jgi:hypothetical protein
LFFQVARQEVPQYINQRATWIRGEQIY